MYFIPLPAVIPGCVIDVAMACHYRNGLGINNSEGPFRNY